MSIISTLRVEVRLALTQTTRFPVEGHTSTTPRDPTDWPGEAPTTGWTDRVPTRPDQVCSAAPSGVYTALTLHHPAWHRHDRPRTSAHDRESWPPVSPGMLSQAVACCVTASGGHTAPLTGLPLQSSAHAARSPAHAGGGAPPRGSTPVHTRSWPQAGHRSGWASPRCAHTVCQASGTGTSTGSCPSAVRQLAKASAWVGWYNP